MSGLVVASYRGPASFAVEPDGTLAARPAAGGLAPSLLSALEGAGAAWVAVATGAADRRAAAEGAAAGVAGGTLVRLVELDPEVQAAAYRVVANGTLWLLHHGLFDRVREPVCDRAWHAAWDGFRELNRVIADAVASEADDGATVVVNDYHLVLVGRYLAERRPDLRTVHFHHTPFCDAEELRVLPRAVAGELIAGLSSFGACGFHTERWAARFRACASSAGMEPPPVFSAPLGPDAEGLRAIAETPGCAERRAALLDRLGGRALLLRSDRVEMAKNLVRGFLAYEELLERRPELRGRVTFLARTYPSREDVPGYLAYRREVEAVAERVNERFGTGDHLPVELEVADDLLSSVAALSCYDVLLVNPVRDGMNLVAKEGPVVNRRHGVVVLSPEAGAFEELGPQVVAVEPFDVSGTAATLERALEMPEDERARRHEALERLAGARPPRRWLDDVVARARPPRSR